MKVTIELTDVKQAINVLSILSRIAEVNTEAKNSPLPPVEAVAAEVFARPVVQIVPLPTGTGATPLPLPPIPSNTVTTTAETDARGFPWDARIHSGNHKKSATGVWQRRRGVSETEVSTVEAELSVGRPTAAPLVIPAVPSATVIVGARKVAFTELVQQITAMLNVNPNSADTIVAIVQRLAGTPNIGELEGKTDELRGQIANELERL